MTYQPKDNTGSLWVNDRKETDKHPDRTGTIVVGGVEYWLSGWLRKTDDGKPYLSLAVKPKEAPARQPAPRAPARGGGSIDDDVPFSPFNSRAWSVF